MTASKVVAEELERGFKFGSVVLADIDPTLSPEDVIKAYVPNYPALANATIGDPDVVGDRLIFPVEKAPVKTKG